MDKETKDYIDSMFNEIMKALVPASSADCKETSEQTDPLSDWNDPDIYPVWKDDTKPHTLDNLDGIHVPVIDGTKILLYPKYKECALLPDDKVNDWSAKGQYNPLYANIDQKEQTDELLKLDSEAAKFVRQFGKDMALPRQLLAIAYYKEKIDELSKLLGGDLLSEISPGWWSCLRYGTGTGGAWCVYGSGGTFDGNCMYYSIQSVPVSLFIKS